MITREGGAEDIDMRFGDEPITPTQLQTLSRAVAQLEAVESEGIRGPASSTDGNVAVFDGTGGTAITDSGKALEDILQKIRNRRITLVGLMVKRKHHGA